MLEYGVETALMLSVLADGDNLFDGWFYQTAETIEELTGLSNYIQSKCISKLKKAGVLEQKNMGMPMKRYFKLNYDCISNQVFKKLESKVSSNLKTSFKETSNNKEDNKEFNNKELKEVAAFKSNSETSYTNCIQKEYAPYQEIMKMFNELCPSYQTLRKMSEGRKRSVKARLKDYNLDGFNELFKLAEESDFLKGNNPRKWKATFDWFMNDNNMTKVLEGNYNNKKDQKKRVYEIVENEEGGVWAD